MIHREAIASLIRVDANAIVGLPCHVLDISELELERLIMAAIA
jgi:hypothetical protein